WAGQAARPGRVLGDGDHEAVVPAVLDPGGQPGTPGRTEDLDQLVDGRPGPGAAGDVLGVGRVAEGEAHVRRSRGARAAVHCRGVAGWPSRRPTGIPHCRTAAGLTVPSRSVTPRASKPPSCSAHSNTSSGLRVASTAPQTVVG